MQLLTEQIKYLHVYVHLLLIYRKLSVTVM